MSINRAQDAEVELNSITQLEKMDSPIHRVDPLVKLIVTLVYIIVTMSYDKYNFFGLFVMILIPVTLYQISGIPVRTGLYKLRFALPLIAFVGIFNPLLDKSVIMVIGSVSITGGWVSFITVMLKGIFAIMMSFLLIATTSMENICYALSRVHMPAILTSLILMTFRYVFILIEETSAMIESYQLRAPGQKGIKYTAWGSFLGQLILRTYDKGSRIYDNMLLRGYNGEVPMPGNYSDGQGRQNSIIWGSIVIVLIVGIRLLLG